MSEHGAMIEDDAIVVMKGRVDLRDERLKLVCMEITRPSISDDSAAELRICLPLPTLTDGTVDSLKRLLSEHPGETPVLLAVGDKTLRLPAEFNVTSTRGLMGELRVLLGPNAVSA